MAQQDIDTLNAVKAAIFDMGEADRTYVINETQVLMEKVHTDPRMAMVLAFVGAQLAAEGE